MEEIEPEVLEKNEFEHQKRTTSHGTFWKTGLWGIQFQQKHCRKRHRKVFQKSKANAKYILKNIFGCTSAKTVGR